jgi:hypothetical protein
MSKATTKMAVATAKTAAIAAAAAAATKTATAYTTGKNEDNYLLMTLSIRPVLKSYGLGTNDKFAVSFDTKGMTNFVFISFYVNCVLPKKGGYLVMLLEDSHTLRWSCPVDLFLFTMEHLCSIMESKYSESNIQVCLFNKVTKRKTAMTKSHLTIR